MSAQPHVDAVPLLPDLGMTRVQIEVHAAANATEDGGVGTELVEEEVDVGRDRDDVLARQADVGRAASLQQRRVVTELEPIDQLTEVTRVFALHEGRRLQVFVHAFLGPALLDVINVEAETPEAEDPLQERPGVAPIADRVAAEGTREEDALRHWHDLPLYFAAPNVVARVLAHAMR